MQAVFYEGNKSLRVGECKPLLPLKGEVQIAVSNAGICVTDSAYVQRSYG
ncbi:hypothetical protein [Paenibacillus psychroresistens]|nr:hypothetical protein [Paenibacillus psychroresistens]